MSKVFFFFNFWVLHLDVLKNIHTTWNAYLDGYMYIHILTFHEELFTSLTFESIFATELNKFNNVLKLAHIHVTAST